MESRNKSEALEIVSIQWKISFQSFAILTMNIRLFIDDNLYRLSYYNDANEIRKKTKYVILLCNIFVDNHRRRNQRHFRTRPSSMRSHREQMK